MSKQTMGSVLGAVGGAILGSQVGKGSGATWPSLPVRWPVVLWATGSAPSWTNAIAKRWPRVRRTHSIRARPWRGNPHTGRQRHDYTISSKTVTSQQTMYRAPKIATVQNMAVINQPYQAIKSVNLRAAPGTQVRRSAVSGGTDLYRAQAHRQ